MIRRPPRSTRTDTLFPYTTLFRSGSAAYRVRWMPGLAAGKIIAAFAIDEGRKHWPEATALSAARVDAGFRLNGIKTFVIGGHLADLLIVSARSEERRVGTACVSQCRSRWSAYH